MAQKKIVNKCKFIPSRTKHYLHCPYFLKLSNTVKIPVEEPHIVAIQRYQFFKNAIIKKLSSNRGVYPKNVQRPIDIILTEGLLQFTKKLDLDFFSTEVGCQ